MVSPFWFRCHTAQVTIPPPASSGVRASTSPPQLSISAGNTLAAKRILVATRSQGSCNREVKLVETVRGWTEVCGGRSTSRGDIPCQTRTEYSCYVLQSAVTGGFVRLLRQLARSKLCSRAVRVLGLLQQAASHIVSDLAARKGLDGEAKRLRALYDSSMVVFGWQCGVCKSCHDSWHSHCPTCGQFAGLKWQQPEKVTPLLGD